MINFLRNFLKKDIYEIDYDCTWTPLYEPSCLYGRLELSNEFYKPLEIIDPKTFLINFKIDGNNDFSVFCQNPVPDKFDKFEKVFETINLTRNIHKYLIKIKTIYDLKHVITFINYIAHPDNLKRYSNIIWILECETQKDYDIFKSNEFFHIPFGKKVLYIKGMKTSITFNPEYLSGVIVSGEYGEHSLPMNPAWIASVKDTCVNTSYYKSIKTL